MRIERVEDHRVEALLTKPSEFIDDLRQQVRMEVEAEFARERGIF